MNPVIQSSIRWVPDRRNRRFVAMSHDIGAPAENFKRHGDDFTEAVGNRVNHSMGTRCATLHCALDYGDQVLHKKQVSHWISIAEKLKATAFPRTIDDVIKR